MRSRRLPANSSYAPWAMPMTATHRPIEITVNMGTLKSAPGLARDPGGRPEAASVSDRKRCAGTKTSRQTMFLDPVPARPMTCQLSSISNTDAGTRTKPCPVGVSDPASETLVPRIIQAQLSIPEQNIHLPESR